MVRLGVGSVNCASLHGMGYIPGVAHTKGVWCFEAVGLRRAMLVGRVGLLARVPIALGSRRSGKLLLVEPLLSNTCPLVLGGFGHRCWLGALRQPCS